MSIELWEDAIPAPTQSELSEFEIGFTYPLGLQQRFRIEHGPDHLAFFRPMGTSGIVIARSPDGVIIGTLCFALRHITPERKPIAYLGGLRLAAPARHGRALARMLTYLHSYLLDKAQAAYAVVMAGTTISPASYTGRIGLPPFFTHRSIAVLQIHTTIPDGWAQAIPANWNQPIGLSAPAPSFAAIRQISRYPLQDIEHGSSHGLLIDTDQAKRLFLTSGEQLHYRHLVGITATCSLELTHLLANATQCARASGHLGIFCALPQHIGHKIHDAAPGFTKVADAEVWNTDTDTSLPEINSSEI